LRYANLGQAFPVTTILLHPAQTFFMSGGGLPRNMSFDDRLIFIAFMDNWTRKNHYLEQGWEFVLTVRDGIF
jgi:hypothetical protein